MAVFAIIGGIKYAEGVRARRDAEAAAAVAAAEARVREAAAAAKAQAEADAEAKATAAAEEKAKQEADAKADAERKKNIGPDPPVVGDQVVFAVTAFLALNDSAYEEASKRLIRNGNDGLEDMEATGVIFVVDAGTVGVLADSSLFSSKCKIRILSGRSAGRSGYTWYSAIKKR